MIRRVVRLIRARSVTADDGQPQRKECQDGPEQTTHGRSPLFLLDDGPLETLLADHIQDLLSCQPAGVVVDQEVVPIQIDVDL